MTKAAQFILCIDRFDAKQGKVWAVQQRGKWRCSHTVVVLVPVQTVFRGVHAKQPKAYLQGRGVVRRIPYTGGAFCKVETTAGRIPAPLGYL